VLYVIPYARKIITE